MDIGRYTVLGRLGRGGMGGVYKVRHRDLGRVMALKLLQPREMLVRLMGEDRVREAFLREAKLLAGCEHRNIASVWDLSEDRGRPFLVLEYLCMNLGTLVGESPVLENPTRPMPMSRGLDFIRQALAGIGYLHARGIVHLDIKPGNLMLDSDGRLAIIDLGMSRLHGQIQGGSPGLKIGTPYYCPPEQEENPDMADGRADLYALAVVLYRLVTGRLPGDGTRASLSDAWQDFFITALNPRPESRFQHSLEMLQALDVCERDALRKGNMDCVMEESRCVARKAVRSLPLRTGVEARPFPFLDSLFRPLEYHEGGLERVEEGWLDACIGLLWGEVSAWPMDWAAAQSYVSDMGGAWRLPTVEELASLLRSGLSLERFCDRPFGDRYLWIWTGDRRSFTSAWFVDVGGGAVLAQDMSCRFHVRPVCMLEPSGSRQARTSCESGNTNLTNVSVNDR